MIHRAKTVFLAGSMLAGLAAFPTIALAQDASQPSSVGAAAGSQAPVGDIAPGGAPSTQSEAGIRATQPQAQRSRAEVTNSNQVQEVVVTGSRIARRNLDQPTPVSTLSPQVIQNAATANLGDIIAQLPAAGFGGTVRSNSNNFGNGAGLNQINLRNLGISRTLVLVDGQRHVAGDIVTNAVDLNSIPTALVDHVEIITGGASAIYGSDAVTGVVNVITKKSFEGIEMEARDGGFDRGFGASYDAYATVGHNFFGGKLNVTLTGYYTKQEGIDASDIPSAANYGGITNFNDLRGPLDPTFYTSPSAKRGDTIFNTLIVPNVGSEYLSRAGVLLNAATFHPQFSFDANGNIVPVPKRTGYNSFAFGQLPANCGISCYFTEDFEQLQSPVETKGANFTMHYDFTPHLHFSLDAKYAQSDADNLIQPSYTFGDFQLQPDNAFISPALATALAGTDPADYPYISKFINNGRVNHNLRQTYRVVAGLSGDFDARFAQIKWDGALNYGENDAKITNGSLTTTRNFAAALDSVIDPATGKAACRINVPSAQANGLPYDYNSNGDFVNETGAFNAASCVPYNPFGINAGQASNPYVFGTYETRDKLTQQVANLNVSFDTSRFFNFQGGPLSFAAGGEYRMERTKERNDPFLLAGYTEDLASDSAGGFNVYEGYVEVSAPLFRHFAPFLDEFSVDAAYRGSQYSTVGHTDAYKFSGVYGPFRDLKFRGTYSVAVRAPNITEAFSPASSSFFNISDPCSAENIESRTNYAANCAAQGIPAGFVANTNASIIGTTGGNPNLSAEQSTSYTVGAVFQPHWVPRLNFTVDYYNIDIADAITLPSAQSIINNCYTGAALDPAFCSLFTRSARTNNINSVTDVYVNAARVTTEGLDFQLTYNAPVAPLTQNLGMLSALNGRLALDLNLNYVIELRRFPFQNDPTLFNVIEASAEAPHFRSFTTLSYQQGGFQVAWEFNYLGKSLNFNRDPSSTLRYESNDQPFNKSELIHNVILRYDLPFSRFQGTQLFLGVNNLFDEEPPGYLLGSGNDVGYSLGRFVFAGLKFRR